MASEAEPQLSLKQRLLAWWEGYDPAALAGRGDAPAEAAPAATPGRKPAAEAPGGRPHTDRLGRPLWSANRIQVAEKIWGEGFATPGGTDHIPTLVKPFGLNPAMSVLDLGAGLGGSTRAMAKAYGAWITGLEYNPVLTEAGMFRSHKAGLARQAPVQGFDPEAFRWPKRVDCIFSKEMLFTVKNKDGLIDAIEACLKPRGQLLFTDYVLDRDTKPGRNFQGWMKNEPVEPHPWTVAQYEQAMAQRNLDIRIAEDISDMHRTLILDAIQALAKHLETVGMEKETKIAVVEEVELWARRVAVLTDGIRVFRIHALKPADLS